MRCVARDTNKNVVVAMSKLVIQSSEDEGQGLERVTAYVEGKVKFSDMKLLQPSKEFPD